MKKTFLRAAAAILFLALPVGAQVVPHVTGTFLTPGAKTPSQASLQQIATISSIPIFGTIEFTPYDSKGNKPIGVLCGTQSYIPQTVKAYIRGDGQMVDATGTLGVDLIPQIGCSPANYVMRATIRLAPSADSRVQSATWSEDKQLPQTSSVDWGSLPVVARQTAQYVGLFRIQEEETTLDQYGTLKITGSGASCAPDAPNARIVCTFNGGGTGGGSNIQVNNASLSDPSSANFRDNATIHFSNPSLGNVEGNIAASGVTDTMIAAGINPGKILGGGEVQLNKGTANGYAPLDSLAKLPLSNLPSHVHAESDVTNLISDLAGKSPLVHTHAASDITSGVLAYARGGFGAIATGADQVFLSTSSSVGGFSTIPDCHNGATDKLLYSQLAHVFQCGADQTTGGGTGITTLNTLTGSSQGFAVTPDTNISMTISSVGSTHTFLMGFLGTLAKARQNSATVYNDQANTLGAFLQDFSAASMKLPLSASPTPTSDGSIAVNSTTHLALLGLNGITKTIATTDANVATATALAANGTNCSGNNWARGVDASGNCEGAQIDFSNLSGALALAQTVMTTRGDLLTVNSTPGFARLAIGAANRTLISNGTDPAWGQIDLSTSLVTNTLGFANGGTSATTRQAAINALLGLNTAGDMVGFDGTNVIRIGIGSLGQCWVRTATSPFYGWGSCATGAISGTGTAGKIPVWTASNTIGDSPFQVATNEYQPVTDAVSDLGDATHRFGNLYLSGSIFMSGSGPLSLEGSAGTCTASGTSLGKLCLDSGTSRIGFSWNAGSYSNFILASDTINALASSSSANLAALLSDETGSASGGLAVFNQSPTIVTPTIASLTNMQHSHQNAAGGGALDVAAITTGAFAKARQNSATVYNDQANTMGAFIQTFLAGANFVLADPTTNTKKATFDLSNITAGQTRSVNVPDAPSTTVQAYTGTTNHFVTAISAQGVVSHAQPDYSQLTGTPTLFNQTVQDEGGALTQRPTMNFIGSGVACADDAANTRTNCTISGGGGGGGTAGPNYGTGFTSQTSVTIAGTSHLLGTKNLLVQCYDNSSPAKALGFAYTVDASSFDVVVTFATAQTGYCAVNGSGPALYASTFSNQTTLSVPGGTHGLGRADLQVHVYDSASGTRNEVFGQVSVDSTTFDVTVKFQASQSGRIVIE